MAGPYHILVVEDEETWREDIFRESLEDSGYQVVTSSSYAEAVAALDRQAFDLVVIDVNLTDVSGNRDGVRVLEHMAARGLDSLAIIVSGSKTWTVTEENVKKLHPIAFIDKTTFDMAKFVTLVTDALTQPSQASISGALCTGND